MAETFTDRFGLRIYGAGTDTPTRVEFNEQWQAIESLAAIAEQGLLADRPTSDATSFGRLYWSTDDSGLWFDTGTVPGVGWLLISRPNLLARPWAIRNKTTAANIADNTVTNVTFGGGAQVNFAYNSGSGELTLADGFDGVYVVTTQVSWETGSTGRRQLQLHKNGTLLKRQALASTALNATQNAMELVWVGFLTGGDVLSVRAYQNSGSGLHINPDPDTDSCQISVFQVNG